MAGRSRVPEGSRRRYNRACPVILTRLGKVLLQREAGVTQLPTHGNEDVNGIRLTGFRQP